MKCYQIEERSGFRSKRENPGCLYQAPEKTEAAGFEEIPEKAMKFVQAAREKKRAIHSGPSHPEKSWVVSADEIHSEMENQPIHRRKKEKSVVRAAVRVNWFEALPEKVTKTPPLKKTSQTVATEKEMEKKLKEKAAVPSRKEIGSGYPVRKKKEPSAESVPAV